MNPIMMMPFIGYVVYAEWIRMCNELWKPRVKAR